MAGSVKIDFDGEWSVLMYDDKGKLVDRYDVEEDNLSFTMAAIRKIWIVRDAE